MDDIESKTCNDYAIKLEGIDATVNTSLKLCVIANMMEHSGKIDSEEAKDIYNRLIEIRGELNKSAKQAHFSPLFCEKLKISQNPTEQKAFISKVIKDVDKSMEKLKIILKL